MTEKIRTFSHAIKFFSELELFGMKFGLTQMQVLAKFAGEPQKSLRFVHVAGTNGKGSVSAMLAEALCGAGFRTGLYTSPHLVSIRERFKINGVAISEDEFTNLSEEVRSFVLKARENHMQPTFFEATTLLALIFFKKQKCDIVVLECGLGGKLDATNIVEPELSVITSIGKDHCEQLGNSFAKIAGEKAGIIKAGVPCFCGKNINKIARKPLTEIANSVRSEIFFADQEAKLISEGSFADGLFKPQKLEYQGDMIETSFPGSHQIKNLPLVCESLKYLSRKLNFSYKSAIAAIRNASLPARMTFTNDRTIIDGGHNPQAVETVVKNIVHYFGKEKFTVIFGGLKDKDVKTNMLLLAKIAKSFVFVTVKGARKSYEAGELLSKYENIGKIPASAAEIEDALNWVSPPRLIIGSFYLAGEVLKKYFSLEKIINWRSK